MKTALGTCLRSLLVTSLALWPLAAAQQSEHPVLLLNEDESFHFELLNALSEAIYSGADVNPILRVAKDLPPGDFESYSQAFQELANQTKAQAEDPKNAYDSVNVRDTWFSAANYFRRADFYRHGNWDDPLINILWDEQTAAFNKAIAALPVPGQRLQIPADNFTVEAIWYPVKTDDNTQRPTFILGNGYDGAQEDLYHTFVVAAHARGWNAITYEGPGHPTVRRNQNIGFIPDWERVVTPVVDYLLTNQSCAVDPSRVALLGFSFGGYLAARAAAFDPRISAVLLDGGVWDTFKAFYDQLPPPAQKLFDSGNASAFDAAVLEAIHAPGAPTSLRWGAEQGLWSFNMRSPYEYLQLTKEFAVEEWIDQIDMPTWVADATYEEVFPGQAKKVADALGDRATFHLFEGSAGYHVQAGAFQELNRVMFAWLNETLG
ncbi:hypothetical protein FQN54_005166 [Arachnomyces sp. PD_36]|nr:hypothetical protein FQN54_005166 [Arachnomyces sp. PD_36]